MLWRNPGDSRLRTMPLIYRDLQNHSRGSYKSKGDEVVGDRCWIESQSYHSALSSTAVPCSWQDGGWTQSLPALSCCGWWPLTAPGCSLSCRAGESMEEEGVWRRGLTCESSQGRGSTGPP